MPPVLFLRKRKGPRAEGQKHSRRSPRHQHVGNGNGIFDSYRVDRSSVGWRRYQGVVVAVIFFKAFLYFQSHFGTTLNLGGNDNAINLQPTQTLSNTPLGVSVDLPKNVGPLEIYLNAELIYSVSTNEMESGTLSKQETDSESLPKQDNYTLNVGTCDFADNDENILQHAFNLGRGGLDNLNLIYLKPGNYILDIEQRKDNDLIHYAQMAIEVNPTPELVISSSYFSTSPYDTAYKLALKEIGQNIACNHFVAGSGWAQLWTRDTSFAAELGAALLHPQVVQKSLMSSVQFVSIRSSSGDTSMQKVWLQDLCGHFGGWPNLSDSIVGARGAWSLYLVTGDKE